MQDVWGLWVEQAGEVVKKFGSQKEIVSTTVEVRGKYVALDTEGRANSWDKDAARTPNP